MIMKFLATDTFTHVLIYIFLQGAISVVPFDPIQDR